MKIALSGLHSQGKTTLLNALHEVEELASFTRVPSPTRILQSEGFSINESGNEITQTCIMMQHLKNVLQYSSNAIFDRCALDGIAYSNFFNGSIVKENLNELFLELFKNTINRYDVIFYIEPELKLEDDNVRSLDENFFNNVKANFENIITQYNVDVVRLKGSVQERVDLIKKTIKINN